jgi:hypothetical protein
MDHPDPIAETAERQLRQGEPLTAYNTLQPALERWPGNLRLRQLQGLALARSGDVERSNSLLAALAAEGHEDGETLGLLARTHKDLALRGNRESRGARLEAAFGLYERAYRAARARGEDAAAEYTGINAAAMAVLRGDLARARALAAEIRASGAAGPADYWRTATRGEAALILGDLADARTHYRQALGLAARNYGDIGSTRRQARLLEAHLPRVDEPASAALAIPPVVAFSGHMIDAPDRAEPRFPSRDEPPVRAAIARRMTDLAPAAVYGSAACGADLLILEAARELGCETHVVLPFPVEAFRRASVDFAGAHWVERFERALAAADSVTIASDHAARGSIATFEYANLILTGMALLRARLLDTSMRALAVNAPDGDVFGGGTASILAAWRRRGLEVEVIELAGVASGTSTRAPVEEPGSAGIRHEMRAMLFADAVGYSRFTEDQIPLYITEFLGGVAALAGGGRQPFEHVETSGDGLYMVFGDAVAAGKYALGLSRLVAATDWAARGLPPGFNIRVALHCGPVHCGRNPLTGAPVYTGPHTSRAARIEPITPPGQVYASSAYAAVAAASGADLDLTYVGRMPLAKGYGALGLYHVRGAE